MDHQATVNGTAVHDASAHAVAQNVAGVVLDIVAIAELQSQLFALALEMLCRGIVRGLIIWGVAAALLVATLPTALAGAGLWLAEIGHVSTATGLLWVALGAFLLAIGLLAWGWRQVTSQRAALRHSINEFRNNRTAMKQILSSYAGRGSAR
jgi:hypothetical protein